MDACTLKLSDIDVLSHLPEHVLRPMVMRVLKRPAESNVHLHP